MGLGSGLGFGFGLSVKDYGLKVKGYGGRSFLLEASISMHRPRMVSDWLIALASSKALPSTPDFFTRSDLVRVR